MRFDIFLPKYRNGEVTPLDAEESWRAQAKVGKAVKSYHPRSSQKDGYIFCFQDDNFCLDLCFGDALAKMHSQELCRTIEIDESDFL